MNLFMERTEVLSIPLYKYYGNLDYAKDVIEKADKSRAAYYNFYTEKRWGRGSSYDICLNSSKISLEQCMDIITQILNK